MERDGKRIAILTPCLHRRDAVGNDIMGMLRVLTGAGHDVRIFTPDSEEDVETFSPRKIPAFLADKNDILIYHYSIAWDVALNLFRTVGCRKIIKYHNVTPPRFFEEHNEAIAGACRIGRSAIGDFVRAGCDIFLADSRYNMNDALDADMPESLCRVVPPLHRIDSLIEQEPDPDILEPFAVEAPVKGANILSVGRIVPNKGYENLLRSFALFRQSGDRLSRLVVVGRFTPGIEGYYARLKRLILSLGIRNSVLFTGGVSASALKSYYLAADAFVMLSEHEGFCVPLVEAMALKIPIIALGSSAIPETAGDAAILWDKPDPALFAASMEAIASDRELSRSMAEVGHGRYRNIYTNEKIGRRLLDSLESLL